MSRDIWNIMSEYNPNISFNNRKRYLSNNYPGWDKGDDFSLLEIGKRGDTHALEYIYELGVSVNYEAIAVGAAENGHMDMLKYLISKGVDDYDDLASAAASQGRVDILKYLLDMGASNYNDIASEAAYKGYRNIVMMMIDIGANNYREIADAARRNKYNGIAYDVEKMQ